MCTFTCLKYNSLPTYPVSCRDLPGAIVPLMKDPLRVLDYDSWWRKDLHNILPYVIPAVKEDIIEKMEVQLEDSSNRSANTRTNGEAIVSHLQSLIEEQKVECTFPFSWNLKLYKSPPKKASTNFEFSPEQLAIIENVHMDNAQKHVQLGPLINYEPKQ